MRCIVCGEEHTGAWRYTQDRRTQFPVLREIRTGLICSTECARAASIWIGCGACTGRGHIEVPYNEDEDEDGETRTQVCHHCLGRGFVLCSDCGEEPAHRALTVSGTTAGAWHRCAECADGDNVTPAERGPDSSYGSGGVVVERFWTNSEIWRTASGEHWEFSHNDQGNTYWRRRHDLDSLRTERFA